MIKDEISVFPLFGYGNFGSNLTIIGDSKDSFILDLGMSFDEDGSRYYEKLSRAMKNKNLFPKFILLTHAHADHVSFILDSAFKRLDLPIYCSEFSRAFLEKRTKKLNITVLEELKEVTIETFRVKPILIDHSCEGTYAFEITNNNNSRITIIPDYKLEQVSVLKNFTPKPDLLFIESTNSIEKNRIDSESIVIEKIENEYDLRSISAKNIFFTTFSVCTRRIMKVVEFAKRENRKLLIAGKALQYTVRILLETNRIEYDKLIFVKRATSIAEYTRKEDNLIILCSGHQGEPNAALPILLGEEAIKSNDLILFLSRQIPDPEAIANRTVLLSKLLVNKIPFVDNIHCSGHAAIPELTCTLKSIDANLIIPMHGDAMNLGGLLDIVNKNKISSRVKILVNNQFAIIKINERQ